MSTENKSLGPSTAFEKCSVVLVDVLGTTTSINFAKETLFPYVVKNVEEVLTAKWDDETLKSAVKQLKEGEDEINLEAAVKLVKDLTESESENAGLKTIQGIVYQKGYESGDLKAHVFSDVPASFESWAKSRKVAVYSSGSAESQKQVFSKSVEGDLSQYVSNYFDLSVGPKTESESYKKIVEKLAVKPEEIVFITDLIEEAKAAKSAGLSTALVAREGNPKLPEESKEFTVISSFKEITFENPAKRKITDEPAVTEEPPSKLAKTACEKDVKSEDKPEESKTVAVPEKPENKETVEGEAMEVDAVETVPTKELPTESQEHAKPETNAKTEATLEKTETTVEDIAMAESESVIKLDETKIEKTEEKKVLSDKKEENVDIKSDTKENTETAKSELEAIKENSEETEPNTLSKEEPIVKSDKNEQDEGTKSQTSDVDKIKKNSIEMEEKNQSNGEVKSDVEKADGSDKNVNVTDKSEVDTEKKCEEIPEKKEVDATETKSAGNVSGAPKAAEKSQAVTSDSVKTNEAETVKVVEQPSKTAEAGIEATSCESKSAIEESNPAKSEEEKENQKDLANKLENGDTLESKKPSNGEVSQDAKTNGDSQQSIDQGTTNGKVESTVDSELVEEIKVKKVEGTSSDTPTVSVEV